METGFEEQIFQEKIRVNTFFIGGTELGIVTFPSYSIGQATTKIGIGEEAEVTVEMLHIFGGSMSKQISLQLLLNSLVESYFHILIWCYV